MGAIRRVFSSLPVFAKGAEKGFKGEAQYYSAAVEAIRTLPQNKGTPEQMINLLSKQKGVKKAELDALKLNKAFEGRKTITRDELLEAAQNALPDVGRNRRGSGAGVVRADAEEYFAQAVRDGDAYSSYRELFEKKKQEKIDEYSIIPQKDENGEEYFKVIDIDGDEEDFRSFEEAEEYINDIAENWTDEEIVVMSTSDIIDELNPSMRDIVAAVPEDERLVESTIDDSITSFGDPTFRNYSQQGDYGPEYRENILTLDYNDRGQGTPSHLRDTYGQSTHFTDSGYLLHTRGSEVSVGSERGYLLDEIQSDLHQSARKNEQRGIQPYRSDPYTPEQEKRVIEGLDKAFEAKKVYAEKVLDKELDVRDQVWNRVERAVKSGEFEPKGDGDPYIDIPLDDKKEGGAVMRVIRPLRSEEVRTQIPAVVNKDDINLRYEILREREGGYDLVSRGRDISFEGIDEVKSQQRVWHNSSNYDVGPRFLQTYDFGDMYQDAANGIFGDVVSNFREFGYPLREAEQEYKDALAKALPREVIGGGRQAPDISMLSDEEQSSLMGSLMTVNEPHYHNLNQAVREYAMKRQDYSPETSLRMIGHVGDRATEPNDSVTAALERYYTGEMGPRYFEGVTDKPMPQFPFKDATGIGVKEGINAAIAQDANFMVLPDYLDQGLRYEELMTDRARQGLENYYQNLPSNKVFKDLGLKPELQPVSMFDRDGNYVTKELPAVRLTPEFKAKVKQEGLPLFTRPESLLGTGMVATQYPSLLGDEVGQEFADARAYLNQRDPNYNYSEYFPLARNKDTGLLKFAVPDIGVELGNFFLDLAESSRTGVARPDAAVGLLF